VVEAGTGFGFLAVVIGYLPVLYQAFSRREINISLLDARAGSPPTAEELLRRHAADPIAFERLLADWERWSAELMESHLSYPALAFYRSQHSNQSWLAALTTVLDASAFAVASLDGSVARQARLTFAIARHAVVDLAQIFRTPPVAAPADRLARPRSPSCASSCRRRGSSCVTVPRPTPSCTSCASSTSPMSPPWGSGSCSRCRTSARRADGSTTGGRARGSGSAPRARRPRASSCTKGTDARDRPAHDPAHRPGDAAAMHAVYGDAEAMRWVGDGLPLALERCEEWVRVTERNYAARGYGMFALEERASGQVAGFAGSSIRAARTTPELKYALAPAFPGPRLRHRGGDRVSCVRAHRGPGPTHRRDGVPQNLRVHRVLAKAGFVAAPAGAGNRTGTETLVFVMNF
jgi:hypothetical protein